MTILLSIALLVFFTSEVFANPACAVCTVAVGASLEIARQLGVADEVVGVWAGAMLALLGYWMVVWFEKKSWKFWARNLILISSSVAMIGFMYIDHLVYSPQIIGIFYIDPFLFATIIGAVVFVYSSAFYQWMKAKNGGRAHFPFEKVAVPMGSLILLSAYFYYYPLVKPVSDLFKI